MFINLIVPPIIIVVAIALLIMFLARVIPKSENEARERQLKKRDKPNSKKEERSMFSKKVIDDEEKAEQGEGSELENVYNNSKKEVNENVTTDTSLVSGKFTAGSRFKKKVGKNKKKGGFGKFFSKINFLKKKINKGRVVLPGINRVDGIKRINSSVSFTQNNEESLSRMDKILLDSRNLTKDPNSSNKEESELVRQISVDPRNSESYRRLGDFYVESDRLTDARECYKYVLRLDPRHKRAQLAMRRLDRILG